MDKQKEKIAKEWEYLTFQPMKGVEECSVEELQRVLDYEKSLRHRTRRKVCIDCLGEQTKHFDVGQIIEIVPEHECEFYTFKEKKMR